MASFWFARLVGCLVAAAIMLGAGCGGRTSHKSLASAGGTRLTYRVDLVFSHATQSASARAQAVQVLQRRVNEAFHTGRVRLVGHRVVIEVPGVTVTAAQARELAVSGRLFFYDWEPNVIGPTGKPAALDPSVTGGAAAGVAGAGSLRRYAAVLRASKRRRILRPNGSASDQYYVVDDRTKHVLGVPTTTSADAISMAGGGRLGAHRRVLKVPAGTIVVRAEPDEAVSNLDEWFVLNDDPKLTGADIMNPEQNVDPQSNAPSVTFDFTHHGKKAWKEMTREIARRGEETVGLSGGGNQHFAIVLDNQLISVPYIDYKRNPDGIDATNGSEITGGFTVKSAQRLANLLHAGPLPFALRLVRRQHIRAS